MLRGHYNLGVYSKRRRIEESKRKKKTADDQQTYKGNQTASYSTNTYSNNNKKTANHQQSYQSDQTSSHSTNSYGYKRTSNHHRSYKNHPSRSTSAYSNSNSMWEQPKSVQKIDLAINAIQQFDPGIFKKQLDKNFSEKDRNRIINKLAYKKIDLDREEQQANKDFTANKDLLDLSIKINPMSPETYSNKIKEYTGSLNGALSRIQSHREILDQMHQYFDQKFNPSSRRCQIV